MTTISIDARPETAVPQGLTSREVHERRAIHGFNVLTPPRRDPWWKLYLEKFEDPIIRILIVAASIAIVVGAFTGHYAEGAGIIIAILLATTLAFINEFKAGQEFELLSRVNDDVSVRVHRNGTVTTVERRAVVPDDLVLIEKGDEVPADGVVLQSVSLEVDESQLTGESVAVEKHPRILRDGDTDRAYPVNQVCRGTFVTDGHAIVRITAIGDATEIGRTAREAAEENDEATPLNEQLEKLSKLIGVVGSAVALLTFAALLVRGVVVGEIVLTPRQWIVASAMGVGIAIATVRVWLPIFYDGLEFSGRTNRRPDWLEREGIAPWLQVITPGFATMLGGIFIAAQGGPLSAAWLPAGVTGELLNFFMIAVTIIVVAVPEGLAMSVTLSLAYSMRKMTATNTLVRRMHACETIGAATVICTDKTGTLTMNEMRVRSTSLPWQTGGAAAIDWASKAGRLLAEAIAANSTAHLDRSGAVPRPVGNPTEGALLLWLDSEGVDYTTLRNRFAIEQQWTFSPDRKFMATLGAVSGDGVRVVHVKGAPEIVLDRCRFALSEDGERPIEGLRPEILRDLQEFQSRGMRTLGLAFARVDQWTAGDSVDSITSDLTWIGCAAIEDPVRSAVPAAIAACRSAGIDVKIVTGDHSGTATEVGRATGLISAGGDGAHSHLLGSEFASYDEQQAAGAATPLRILSRAKPADKLKLVRTLQRQGHVVAVTGDGTNDAPALNHADVGLAMGRSGTAVAKQASDIVLLDDSFASIVKAVQWGRSLYENIQRFILFQLTINVAALGIALAGPFVGVKLPLTVTQMLWINLIMDTFAALALATEPPHDNVMTRPPRGREAFIITPAMARSIFGFGAFFLAVLLAFLVTIARDGVVNAMELSVFFSVFVLLQFWNLFNARSLGTARSAFTGLFANKAFVAIASAIFAGQICIVQFGGSAFRTVPLSLRTWVTIFLVTSPVLLIGEAWRWLQRHRAPAAN